MSCSYHFAFTIAANRKFDCKVNMHIYLVATDMFQSDTGHCERLFHVLYGDIASIIAPVQMQCSDSLISQIMRHNYALQRCVPFK